MDINFTTTVVKCIAWILFQFVQDTAAYVAEMRIEAGENISLFDLENLKGYKCGTTGTFRNGDIDTERKANCPKEVWICFDTCGVGMYGKLKTTDPSGNLLTWMEDPPLWPTGTFSVRKYGFDFMFNVSLALTRSAVYNPGPPEVHPKFYYIPSSKPAEPVNNLPVFNPSGSTNFIETTKLFVRYIFDDNSCTKPTVVKETNTCEEAFADAKPTTTTEAATTDDPTTSTTHAPTTTTTAPIEISTTITTTDTPSTTESTTTSEKMTSKTTSFPETTAPETTPDTTAFKSVTSFIDTTTLYDTTAMAYVTTTTTYVNTTKKLYMCPCDCDYYAKVKYWENVTAQNLTLEQQLQRLQPEIEATKKELTVNKSDLSSFRNKKISASDDRTSSKSIGLISTVFMCMVIGSLIVCDLMSLKKHVRHVKNNCCSNSSA